jgi:truncated hemoglobin YjbI
MESYLASKKEEQNIVEPDGSDGKNEEEKKLREKEAECIGKLNEVRHALRVNYSEENSMLRIMLEKDKFTKEEQNKWLNLQDTLHEIVLAENKFLRILLSTRAELARLRKKKKDEE